MVKKPIPYMQFYIADYIGDTLHLSVEQHGAYILIICAYWQTQKPPKESSLPAIVRMSSEQWKEHRDIMSEFFDIKDGAWHHRRIDTELQKVRIQAKKNRIAGKKSGASRRAKKEQNERAFNERSTNDERNVNQSYVKDEIATLTVLNPKTSLSRQETELLKARERVWTLEREITEAGGGS